MKNQLLYLLFFFSAVTALPAQNTNWFVPGARWAYEFISLGGPGTSYFEFKQEEMFQGELCARLRWYTIKQAWPFGGPALTNEPDQYFFVRNDSVFHWNQVGFKLLYDFTRVPGDTMYGMGQQPDQHIVVTDTGTTLIQGVALRFQKLKWSLPAGSDTTLTYQETVYERLGGSHLIYPYIASPLTEIEYYLSCYRDNQMPGSPDCLPDVDFTYRPFPQIGGSWSEQFDLWCGFNGYQFKTEGDSVIFGVGQGKKLYYRPTYTGSYPCPTAFVSYINEPWKLLGLLDQSIPYKKVFFTRLSDESMPFLSVSDSFPPLNQTRLLYDFDLQPGQQLAWKPQPNIFDHLDSIQIDDGTWRRRYFFRDENGIVYDQHYWLEGIGGSQGLFTGYINPYYTDVSLQLRCFKDINVLKYSTVGAENCDSMTVATNEPGAVDAAIQFYPNPNNGAVFLELPEGIPAVDVEVFDLYGRLLEHRAYVQDGNKIDMPGKGMFFLRVRLPDGRQVARRAVSE
jgi:hypothetical protein